MPNTKVGPLAALPPLAASVEVARLELLRIVRGRALRATAVMILLLVVAATLGCILGDGDSGATFTGTARGLYPFLAIAVALLFATRAMAEDVETATVHFLLMLPMPRWAVVVGKYLAAAAVTAGTMVAATVLLYIGTHLAEPSMLATNLGELARATGAIAAASLCYASVFLLLGAALTDMPFLLSLLYVAVLEVALGSVSLLELASVRYHAGVLMGVPHQAGFLGTPDTPVWVAALVVSGLTAVALGLTALLAETSEYRTGRP